MGKKKSDDQYSDEEATRRANEALRRALTSPPKPHSEMKIGKRNAKASHAPKAGNCLRTLDPLAVAAIRLLILTGARLREILDAQWQHVDFAADGAGPASRQP